MPNPQTAPIAEVVCGPAEEMAETRRGPVGPTMDASSVYFPQRRLASALGGWK